jgi:WD40 repeat protein
MSHEAEVRFVEFSPDGRWVLSASWDGTARLWEVPSISSPIPGWLSELAEAVAAQRLNAQGSIELVPMEELLSIKRKLTGSNPAAANENTRASELSARWAKWFFADRARRTISLGSSLTAADLPPR